MDIINVVAKLAVLGLIAFQVSCCSIVCWLWLVQCYLVLQPMDMHVCRQIHQRKNYWLMQNLERILYLPNRKLFVNQSQSSASAPSPFHTFIASGQASDGASNASHQGQSLEPIPEPASLASNASSDALQSVQRVQSPAASGQANASATDLGQGVPVPVEPAPSLAQHPSAGGGSASPQNPEGLPVNQKWPGFNGVNTMALHRREMKEHRWKVLKWLFYHHQAKTIPAA